MNTYTNEIHKEALIALTRLLEARLLLIDCKYALVEAGIKPDLVAKIDRLNAGFTVIKWEDTRPTTGKVIEVLA